MSHRRTCRPVRFSADQRRERPRCAYCDMPIKPLTMHAYHKTADDGPKVGEPWKGLGDRDPVPVLAVSPPAASGSQWVTAYWSGYFWGYCGTRQLPLFDTARCALRFAQAAYNGGHRVNR